MLALGTSTELDAHLRTLPLLFLSNRFLIEVLIALKVALWLLKEVKVGLEHDESSIRCLSDQLILLHGQGTILGCCVAIFDEVCWIESFYDFELALELTMTHLMETVLVILVAQAVDSHSPSLQQMRRFLNDMDIKRMLGLATTVPLNDLGNVA